MTLLSSSRRIHIPSSLMATGLAALASACSSGEVNLGGGLGTQASSQPSRCAQSPILSESVHVSTQADLDALQGCEEIDELRIEPMENLDLSPLASLRVVSSALQLGDPNESSYAESGWIDTLRSLKALERAEVLYLNAVAVDDLSELESLRDLDGLVLLRMPRLQNLAGLEALELPYLWITTAPQLRTLDGLNYASDGELLIIENTPALENIDALAHVESMESLHLWDTGLEALPDLSELRSATSVSIGGNPRLTDVSGLSGLQRVEELEFRNNELLRSLPQFSQLRALEVLRVYHNDALEEVVLDSLLFESSTESFNGRNVRVSRVEIVDISDNAELRRIASPGGFDWVANYAVTGNASLTDVDLGRLERADLLIISENPALQNVTAPSLVTVDELEIIDNPNLVAAAFDDIPTFRREVRGNAAP